MRISYPKWRILIPIGAAIFAATLWPAELWSQGEKKSDQYLTSFGASTYRVYCANCHGTAGKGDGQVAEYLRSKPTDLTVLAKKNDGKFPGEKVFLVIDGREEVKLHGSREMPIWGDALSRPGPNPEAAVEERIRGLVAFIRSIQQK